MIQVLFLSGPFVASLIWPIVCGLYWESVSVKGVNSAIIIASVVGVVIYFTIGWFVATLASAAISFIITIGMTKLAPEAYDWNRLQEA